MTSLAPILQAFFTERLQRQKQVSPHTIAAYRDAFRLLLGFADDRIGKAPSDLLLDDIDESVVCAFLQYLEEKRGDSVRTRNHRLAAIRSFFRYASVREPAHSAMIQRVLAIPQKRCDRTLVGFLDRDEVQALLDAPDRTTWMGRRDHALILVAVETGLRVSELTALQLQHCELGAGQHVRCLGKGRKERCTPLLRKTATVLKEWTKENGPEPSAFLFPTRDGTRLSNDAVQRLVSKHAAKATLARPALANKNVTPHILRHTSAVQLLRAGVDRATIALWLGHEGIETTQIYLDADLAMKEKALARTAPPEVGMRRYQPPDKLLAFLVGL